MFSINAHVNATHRWKQFVYIICPSLFSKLLPRSRNTFVVTYCAAGKHTHRILIQGRFFCCFFAATAQSIGLVTYPRTDRRSFRNDGIWSCGVLSSQMRIFTEKVSGTYESVWETVWNARTTGRATLQKQNREKAARKLTGIERNPQFREWKTETAATGGFVPLRH